jgi:uncharacterized repeat protein (TIGR01451 family)
MEQIMGYGHALSRSVLRVTYKGVSALVAVALMTSSLGPILALPESASAATSGPNFPTVSTGSTWSTGSDVPANAYTSNNSCARSNSAGEVLKLTGFSFAVPATDVISGILVEVEYASSDSSSPTASVRLVKAGTAVGDTRNIQATPSAADCASAEFVSVGATDMWGTTWTPTEINASDFGVLISNIASGNHRIDSVRITVTHAPVPTTATLTLEKSVINDDGGTAVDTDWTLTATGLSVISGAEGDSAITGAVVDPDTYTLSESGPAGYASLGWSCTGGTLVGDDLTLVAGDNVTCTITNDDIAPELTVTKVVVTDNGGTATTSDFSLFVANGIATTSVSSGATTTFSAGDYSIIESGPSGYIATFSGDCAADGSITLEIGETYSCTITNDDIAPGLTVVKVIVNDDGGTATTSNFALFAGNGTATTTVTSGVAEPLPAGTYTVFESGPSGYSATFSGACDSNGVVTLGLGDALVCTITNDDIAPLLTVTKIVDNSNGFGTSTVSDFDLFVGITQVVSGVQNAFMAGSYTISETGPSGYTATFSDDCDSFGAITLEVGGVYTCTITNEDIVFEADLELTKTVDNATPDEGDTVTFTITVTNNGPDDATNIVVSDTLPTEVTYVSSGASAGSYDDNTGMWTIPFIANGGTATLTITVTINGGTLGDTFENVASISALDQVDTDSGNNSDGSGDVTVTETPTPPTPPSGGGGGNGPIVGSFGLVLGASTGPVGQVLGVSTSDACSVPLLTMHLRRGRNNSADEVRKLQQFLNIELGSSLPITGFFGPLTEAAVRAFQAKYAAEILAPWGITTPTGLVYLTTIRKINQIECSALHQTLPPLVPWSQNPNA